MISGIGVIRCKCGKVIFTLHTKATCSKCGQIWETKHNYPAWVPTYDTWKKKDSKQ